MSARTMAMEASMTAQIKGLRLSGNPIQFELAQRLQCCQYGRKDRRRGLKSDWPPMCRSVACVFCRGGIRKREGMRVAKHFADADNEACSFATIMLVRIGDLDTIPKIVGRLRTCLRNLRDRHARHDPRWASLEATGMVEVDAMTAETITVLPPQRRMVIENLPQEGAGDTVWVLHVHLAVHAPELSRDELREAFQRQYPGSSGRVDVQPFHSKKVVPANAAHTVSYAAKHAMEIKLTRGYKEAWPPASQLLYWGWLYGQHDGLRPLRVRLGPKARRSKTEVEAPVFQQIVDAEVTPADPDEVQEIMGNHVAIPTGQEHVLVEAEEPVPLASHALAPASGSLSTKVLGKVVGVLRGAAPGRVRAIVNRIRGVLPSGPVWQDAGSRLRAGLVVGWQLLSLAFVLAYPTDSS